MGERSGAELLFVRLVLIVVNVVALVYIVVNFVVLLNNKNNKNNTTEQNRTEHNRTQHNTTQQTRQENNSTTLFYTILKTHNGIISTRFLVESFSLDRTLSELTTATTSTLDEAVAATTRTRISSNIATLRATNPHQSSVKHLKI